LGDLERVDMSNLFLESACRIPKLDIALKIQPELRRGAEKPAEPKRHLRRYGPTLAQQLVHRLPGHAGRLGERRHGHAILRKEPLAENLARVNRAAREGARVGDTHGSILRLVILAELDVVRVTVLETKADPPLIIDGDRVLTRTVCLESVESVPGEHAQIREWGRHMNGVQLAQGSPSNIRGDSPRLPGAKELFGLPVGEGFDHTGL